MKEMRFTLILFALTFSVAYAQDAKEIVKKADAKMRGEQSSISQMTMKIVRPTWERTISFKSWSKGTDYSLVLITAPAKEKGQSFLKFKREMWSWNPSINRMIKLPPSMLSQGWMGSDFTNDDLLNESSIVVDYTHKILGNETVSGKNCYKIELIPKENAPVVWGKVILWISKDDYLQLKSEYYDEDNILVKTEIGSDIKTMSGRVIPTKFELIPADKEGNKTIMTLDMIEFNNPITENFFTQQNMKKVR
ncbi:MAG TPA: outer membrane lipoprotein-sorting protein [Bacteroidales bacterium]|nr:outer membrane lipoprotein-sorting protein [Bacteroidales bacterium]